MSGKFAIVAADFYGDISSEMLKSARAALREAGVGEDGIDEHRVPGALEIPLALKYAASGGGVFAMAALGCVVRGETYHFEVVADTCARGILQVQLDTGVPVGNGVLTVETMAQAKERTNKAADAVNAALTLAKLKQQAGAL